MIRAINYKGIDMTNEEYDYFNELVKEFTYKDDKGIEHDGKEQFKDVYSLDGDGCISMIKPPLKKKVAWSVLVFLQNLMINQRLRRMEKQIQDLRKGSLDD